MPERDLNVELGLPAGTMTNAACEALRKRYRHRRLYMPKGDLAESHPLVRLLGAENALRLQAAIGRGVSKEINGLHRLQLDRRNEIICGAIASGRWSESVCANKLGLSRRQVQRIRKAAREPRS